MQPGSQVSVGILLREPGETGQESCKGLNLYDRHHMGHLGQVLGEPLRKLSRE